MYTYLPYTNINVDKPTHTYVLNINTLKYIYVHILFMTCLTKNVFFMYSL